MKQLFLFLIIYGALPFNFDEYCLSKEAFCAENARNFQGTCDRFLAPTNKAAAGGFGDVYPTKFWGKNAVIKKLMFLRPPKPGKPTLTASAAAKQIDKNKQIAKLEAEFNYVLKGTSGIVVAGACVQTNEYVAFIFNNHGRDAEAMKRELKSLSFTHIARFSYRLGRIIGNLHAKGIVHADLKPKNVLLEFEGPKREIWVIDLGGACYLGQPCFVSTKLYAPPERNAKGKKTVGNFAIDAYSFALTIAFLADPSFINNLEKDVSNECWLSSEEHCHAKIMMSVRARTLAMNTKFRNIILDGLQYNPSSRKSVTEMTQNLRDLYKELRNGDNNFNKLTQTESPLPILTPTPRNGPLPVPRLAINEPADIIRKPPLLPYNLAPNPVLNPIKNLPLQDHCPAFNQRQNLMQNPTAKDYNAMNPAQRVTTNPNQIKPILPLNRNSPAKALPVPRIRRPLLNAFDKIPNGRPLIAEQPPLHPRPLLKALKTQALSAKFVAFQPTAFLPKIVNR